MTTILSNGLVIGAIYGLVALGITLVYKKSRVLNFAHGEVGMFGAFVFYVLSVEQELPYLVAAAAGVATSAVLGCADLPAAGPPAVRPAQHAHRNPGRRRGPDLRGQRDLGAGPVLRAAAPRRRAGRRRRHDTSPGSRLLVLGAGIVLAVGFFVLFRTSRMALLFRASASDPYAAELMGVDVTRLDVVTWTVAGALAGLAAVLVAPLVGFDIFFMTLLAIRGFAAALLAGLSNVARALWPPVSPSAWPKRHCTRQTTQPGLPEAVLVGLIVLFLLRPQATVRRTA